jgi:3-oxoadipate enol-lactonase
MPTLNANDCDFYYEITGTGPDVVFIHGEDHHLEMFQNQVAHFSNRYRCIAYDRRGHRKSQLTPFGYSLYNQTLDLTGLLDHLRIQRPVLVAFGMGAPIATSFALANPGRVRGLVLAARYELDGYPMMEVHRRGKHPTTFPKFHMQEFEALRDGGPQGLVEFFRKGGDALLPILPANPELREQVMHMIASHPPEHFIKAAEFCTSLPNLTDRLKEITCPILGICGTEDPSPDNPGQLAGARNFEQVWIPGSRRFSMLEEPVAFNAALDRFFGAVA